MKRMKRLVIGSLIAATIGVMMFAGSVTLAHNAGHLHLRDGRCLNVGGGNEAASLRDKMPELDGDQFGARWAAEKSPRIYPRHCEQWEPNHTH